MTQETAKERIYRETLEKTRDRLDGFEELYANKEVYYAFDELTGLVEKGLSQASKIPVNTDKLSVEKLQEIRVEELKDFNFKILQAELKNQKLQEQLNTAKMALTEIASSRQEIYRGGTSVGLELTEDAKIAYDALAAIGGDK